MIGMPTMPGLMRHPALRGIAAALAIVLIAFVIRPYARGVALVVRAADLQGPIRRLADVDTVPIAERIVQAPIGDRSIRMRLYDPGTSARQTVLLVSGLHPAGIDEPRLVALARTLAEANVRVVTPDIPELSRFEITPILTDRIESSAAWLAAQSDLAPRGRIGLMGVSFSGGLAVVAAGRPSLRNRLLYVFSFGGHDDLRRVLEYFCGQLASDGCVNEAPPRPAHDYGVAVVLLNVAARAVPAGQVEPLQHAVRRFLWASHLDRFDKPAAQREFAALRDVARTLPEPSATLLGYVNNRDVAHLGPLLLPHLRPFVDAPALSPARSPGPNAPLFLLHGADDNVIPAVESQRLADRVGVQTPVRLLVTDLIAHAETGRSVRLIEVLKLAYFWGDLLDR
jgi:fermentation-respiration switch protein FrsA (DUF1100 family)